MPEIAIVVEYIIKQAYRDACLARVRRHRATVLSNEPGCKTFNILAIDREPNEVMLYEVYADEAAFEMHATTPYMAAYRDDFAPMSESRSVIRGRLANARAR